MKLTILEDKEMLFEMANIRGKTVKIPHKLNFSFFFSSKDAVESKELIHGLRVKPVFNPEKVLASEVGTLKLFGDWKYVRGVNDGSVDSKDVRNMINFFKYYKILFAAVWEKQLPHDAVQDFFKGNETFSDLMTDFYFYSDYEDDLNNIETIEELNDFVRENKLFNMWDK